MALCTSVPINCILFRTGANQFTSKATEWGKQNEFEKYKNSSGHDSLYYAPSGFIVVHDPSEQNAFGLAEVKCPFIHREGITCGKNQV